MGHIINDAVVFRLSQPSGEMTRMLFDVDVAWGGGLVVSKTGRCLLSGIEYKDAVTSEVRKSLATPMRSAMFLTRNQSPLSQAFDFTPGCVSSTIRDVYPAVTSLQWSRRFVELRLFPSLAAGDWSGHVDHVERAIWLAEDRGKRLSVRGWRVCEELPLAVLCTEPPVSTKTCPQKKQKRNFVGHRLGTRGLEESQLPCPQISHLHSLQHLTRPP